MKRMLLALLLSCSITALGSMTKITVASVTALAGLFKEAELNCPKTQKRLIENLAGETVYSLMVATHVEDAWNEEFPRAEGEKVSAEDTAKADAAKAKIREVLFFGHPAELKELEIKLAVLK